VKFSTSRRIELDFENDLEKERHANEGAEMSELAFDEHGQRVPVPDSVDRWRVRRFNHPNKPGTCAVVYGEDSLPLFLDVNTAPEEFREAVGHIPGRYRLDGVDAHGDPVPGVPPVYLVINGPATAGASASAGYSGGYSAGPPAGSALEYALVEVARANSEAIKAMADKFSGVCDSVAKVMAAADGAALPRRAPLGPLLVDHVEHDDDDEDERNAAPQPAAQPTITTVLTQVMQMVQAVMQMSAGGGNPAKVGAVMGQVVETAKVVEAIGTTAGEPSATPATDEPISDHHDVHAATTTNVNGTHVINGTHAARVAPREAARARPSSPGAGRVAPASAPAMTQTGASATSPPAADPMAHFGQIMAALTPEEQAHVQYVITRLSVLDLMQWYEQLAGMSVAEGAAKIRAELARVPMEEKAA
jgi:hypothetical protein